MKQKLKQQNNAQQQIRKHQHNINATKEIQIQLQENEDFKKTFERLKLKKNVENFQNLLQKSIIFQKNSQTFSYLKNKDYLELVEEQMEQQTKIKRKETKEEDQFMKNLRRISQRKVSIKMQQRQSIKSIDQDKQNTNFKQNINNQKIQDRSQIKEKNQSIDKSFSLSGIRGSQKRNSQISTAKENLKAQNNQDEQKIKIENKQKIENIKKQNEKSLKLLAGQLKKIFGLKYYQGLRNQRISDLIQRNVEQQQQAPLYDKNQHKQSLNSFDQIENDGKDQFYAENREEMKKNKKQDFYYKEKQDFLCQSEFFQKLSPKKKADYVIKNSMYQTNKSFQLFDLNYNKPQNRYHKLSSKTQMNIKEIKELCNQTYDQTKNIKNLAKKQNLIINKHLVSIQDQYKQCLN